MELTIDMHFEAIEEAVEAVNKLKEAYPDDKLFIKVSIADYGYLN